jgi:PAS domain S-box-containing protein
MSQPTVPPGERNAGPDRGGTESGPGAEDRTRLLDLLQERLRFETLLSRFSADFINLPPEAVDGQIERGLRQIVEFLGIERSSLAQFSEDGRELVVTHSYTIPGFAPFPRVNLAAVWPWYTAQIRRGEVLRFTRLPEEAPPEAAREREHVTRAGGPRSHLAIPFKVGEAILGGIGFGSFRREIDWSDDLVRSLQLVGEVFANALARKRADLVLRESEARLRSLLESTKAVPWAADAESRRFTYVGPQAGALFGYPPDAWYAAGFWADHLHPEDREAALAFRREHDRGQADYEFDYRMTAADGRTVWVHDVVHVVSENGAPRTLRGFLVDVTARRRAEEESRVLREHLARVARATLLGELAASIAHEVNQPLCAIVSNAQAVQRMVAGGFDADEVVEALKDITRDGQRASTVIARIRGFFRKATAERAPVGVNDLVREVSALLRAEMARRGVAVTLALAERLPVVLGDRVQLQQVILNLMANAADAMDRVAREARELVVRSSADESGGVAVAVTDAGVGLDPGNVERVFDAFFTTKPGGLGMGLAICKSIVEAHGGRIGARPNAGRGTTFQFTLPGIPLAGSSPPRSGERVRRGGREGAS